MIPNEQVNSEQQVAGSEQQAAPDPYANATAVSRFIDDAQKTYSRLRYVFEREWFRNVAFYAGNQWISYDKSTRQWTPRKLPGWFPRYITNKFAEKVNDIVAALRRPTLSYTPTNGETPSVALAEVGSQVERVLVKEAEIEAKEPLLRAWLVLTGNAFLLPGYDEDESGAYGTMPVAGAVCAQCGYQTTEQVPACPQCGGPMQPSQIEIPKGRFLTDVVSPFEIYCDSRTRSTQEWQGFNRIRSFAKEEAKEIARKLFGNDVDTADIDAIGAGEKRDTSQVHLESLAYITSQFGSTAGSGTAPEGTETMVRFIECFHLPTKDYPQGLYALRIGDSPKYVKAKPLWSKRRTGQPFLPIIHFGGDIVPGRFWRKTRLDDLISKQNQRNLCEALIMLILQRMGAPGWLIPRGSGVDKISGAPGFKLFYTAISAGGTSSLKPERLEGEQIPQTLLLWLNKIDDDIERVAGTFFLQGGNAPPGVHAASALAYLGEQGQKAMSPWIQSYEKGWARWADQALEIFRTRAAEPRIYIAGGQNRWETKRFIGTDLEGEVEAQAEVGSAYPTSQAAVRETVQSLIQIGVINTADPITAYNLLQQTGLTHLAGAVDDDFKIAASEFDDFLNGKMPEIEPVFDNHTAHWVQHSRDAKSDKYRDLPPEQRGIWTQHALQHAQILMQQQSMGIGPVPAGAGPGVPPPSAGGGARPVPGRPPSPAQGGTIPQIRSPQNGEQLQPTKQA